MINFRLLKVADHPLFIAVVIILFIGTLMILSSTYSMQARAGGDSFLYLKKHLLLMFIGFLAMAGMMYLDFNNLKVAAIPLYAFITIMLLFVLVRGFTVLGAQRWISLGFFSFQPSEPAKLIIIIALAYLLENRVGKLNTLFSFLPILLLVGIPFLLIFRQPDLGTALVILVISLGMLVWAKARIALIAALFSPLISILFFNNIYLWVVYLVVLALLLAWAKLKTIDSLVIFCANIASGYIIPLIFGMLKGYQRQRILAFLNPSIDPRGSGYHSLQAKVAVGSGKFFGRGLFHGTQTQLQFIPQQFSDFIFSAVGEELGFLGSMLVLILFVFLIFRAIKIAMESRTVFGSLLASGIAAMFTFHLFVNIGMSLGILPVVGMPLPLMSFGGTFLIINLASIGILQSIAMRKNKLVF